MRLPFDRDQLRKRNSLDLDDERMAAAHRTPERGLIETIELCEVVRQLATATGSAQSSAGELEEKARRYVRPLKAVQRRARRA